MVNLVSQVHFLLTLMPFTNVWIRNDVMLRHLVIVGRVHCLVMSSSFSLCFQVVLSIPDFLRRWVVMLKWRVIYGVHIEGMFHHLVLVVWMAGLVKNLLMENLFPTHGRLFNSPFQVGVIRIGLLRGCRDCSMVGSFMGSKILFVGVWIHARIVIFGVVFFLMVWVRRSNH